MLIHATPAFRPELDTDYVPAVLWNREYQRMVRESGRGIELAIALYRPNGTVSTLKTTVFPHRGDLAELNVKYVERLIKFLLWMKGGYKVSIAGCDELATDISEIYSRSGIRAFDYKIMGERIYGHPFQIVPVPASAIPDQREISMKLGGHLDGCRVGFDLGGSDRKCAATINGEVIYSEEVAWDPYFQKDPEYHRAGIIDSLQRAAQKLPHVDAIGGSAAGVYVDNQPRISSLFRGVPEEEFKKAVVPMFHEISKIYDVPFIVANDGEVTALAGAMSMESTGVIGISMGTSVAAGYVNLNGNITDWLNELAFTPVDYRDNAPVDEWSGDTGCGVQYFCQQGVARLAKTAGIDFPPGTPMPKQLEQVQALMQAKDPRAAAIYRTIGVCFGYAIAHYAEFYDIRNLLILGRVSSGEGGEVIISETKKVLETEFPELARQINIRVPDEKFKRHGQAVIAASLPEIEK